jgi:hypothetical protein
MLQVTCEPVFHPVLGLLGVALESRRKLLNEVGFHVNYQVRKSITIRIVVRLITSKSIGLECHLSSNPVEFDGFNSGEFAMISI